MTDYRCMFSTSDRHRKLNQLRWQNMSAHLTNETSYLLKKLLMHLNWAIYDVCDLNIDPPCLFFPDLVTGSGSANTVSTARSLSATQREACMRSLTTQKPKRLPRVILTVSSISVPHCNGKQKARWRWWDNNKANTNDRIILLSWIKSHQGMDDLLHKCFMWDSITH